MKLIILFFLLASCSFKNLLPELRYQLKSLNGLEQYVLLDSYCAKTSIQVTESGDIQWGEVVAVPQKKCLSETLIAYPEASQKRIEGFIKEAYLRMQQEGL